MRRLLATTALLVLGALSCGPRSQQASRVPLTERQRDSVLARSSLPGASVVGRAMDVSDRAADRAAGSDAADSLFR
jgi:hypothetical protein